MSVEWNWREDGRGLHRQYIGDISLEDVLEATMTLQDHPLFPSLRYLIEDYTGATNAPFAAHDLKEFSSIVSLRSRTKEELMVAIISRDTPESTYIANRFCEFMQQCHYRCHVFHTLADAQAWVDRA